MEDFSNFIQEEIFLIDTEEAKPANLSVEKTYQLGIVTNNTSDKDNSLLKKILSALKLDTTEIFIAKTHDVEKSNRWIIFADSYHLESSALEFYQPCKIKETTFILAQPLSSLHESQEEKQKLWNVLKVLI